MPKAVDVLIIGAGIMGVAAAYYLKKNNPGKRVLLVDRLGAPGQGNTGRSNAMYRNMFSSSDNQLLADRSIDFYRNIQSEGNDLGLQQIGYLWLMSPEGLSRSEGPLKRMRQNGIMVKEYSSDELKAALPDMRLSFDGDAEASLMGLGRVEGGLFGPKCGRLDPDKLARFYASMYTKLGGESSYNTNVERLNLQPSERLGIDGEPLIWQDADVVGVHVRGAIDGDIQAGAVILACGAWGNELLEPAGFDGHVKAKKRQMFSIQAGSGRLRGLLRTKGFNDLGLLPMVILPKAGVHFKPVSEENEFWAGCEDEVNRPYIDVPEHDLGAYNAEESFFANGLHPVLRSYFPAFAESRPRSMWAGLYSYNTIDFLPFAFRHGNLIVVGGDSGSGIMKGDSLGRIADALYREEGEATLFGDVPYRTSKVSIDHRDVEREEWTL